MNNLINRLRIFGTKYGFIPKTTQDVRDDFDYVDTKIRDIAYQVKNEIEEYFADKEVYDSLIQNVMYHGKNKQHGQSPNVIIAYDKTMLGENADGTNVLYSDAHVEFREAEWLEKQINLIYLEQSPVLGAEGTGKA